MFNMVFIFYTKIHQVTFSNILLERNYLQSDLPDLSPGSKVDEEFNKIYNSSSQEEMYVFILFNNQFLKVFIGIYLGIGTYNAILIFRYTYFNYINQWLLTFQTLRTTELFLRIK